MFKEVTCDQVVLGDPETVPNLIARAFKNYIVDSQLVYIEVPRDKVFVDCGAVSLLPTRQEIDSNALNACTDEIIQRIDQANSLVLMAGTEIS